VRIGHYAAYGVRDFNVNGRDAMDGAIIECLGTESCRETAINAAFVSTIDCDGVRSCKDAEIVVDNPSNQFSLECAGIESCYGLKIEINIPSLQDCNKKVKLGRITCESDKSCEGLEIRLNNEGCNEVMIESVTCTQIGSCKGAYFIIGNNIGINSFPCTTDACTNCLVKDNPLSVGRSCDEFVNGVQPNTNSNPNPVPIVIVDPLPPSAQVIGSLNPKPTPAPLSSTNARYCCLTSIDAFDPWKGYCWGNDNEAACVAVPNDRCVWDCTQEFATKPTCSFRGEFCLSDAECCSTVCVFDTTANQRGSCR